MKLYYFASLLCLAGCKKNDQPVPQLVADFGALVTLHYQQSAVFSKQSISELIITVVDVDDSRCPQDVTCLQPGVVQTVLGIQEKNGANQMLNLSLIGITSNIDSAAVQANGARYTVILHKVTPYPSKVNVPKKDKQVIFTVERR